MAIPVNDPIDHPIRRGLAAITTFAVAALFLTAGTLTVLQGIAGLAEDELIVVGDDYTYRLDGTTWGWIHIVIGALILIVAVGLLMAATWARVVAIGLAALSIIANFLWLPYYPLWSILVIVLDVVVIWAVATWDA